MSKEGYLRELDNALNMLTDEDIKKMTPEQRTEITMAIARLKARIELLED